MSRKYTTRQCPICGEAFQVSSKHPETKTCGNKCADALRHPRRTHEQRVMAFWSRVDKSGGDDACWPWTGKSSTNGYGWFYWEGQAHGAHRFSYLLAHGDPGELLVLHDCDNPPCCNPKHLFLGTHQDNAEDKARKGRGNSPRGEQHGCAKLNEADVLTIRQRYAAGGVTMQQLATEYGVGTTAIDNVVKRKRWSHV